MNPAENLPQPEEGGFEFTPSELLERYKAKQAGLRKELKQKAQASFGAAKRVGLIVALTMSGASCNFATNPETNQTTLEIETEYGTIITDKPPGEWDYFPKTHLTEKGDSFDGIAKEYYGQVENVNLNVVISWLMAANPTIADQPALPVGVEVEIPVIPEYRHQLDPELINEEPLRAIPKSQEADGPEPTPTLNPAVSGN